MLRLHTFSFLLFFSNFLLAQSGIEADSPLQQGYYTKVHLSDTIGVASVEWEVINGQIINYEDLQCINGTPNQVCTTTQISNNLLILWGCDMSIEPTIIARTTDTNGNQTESYLVGTTYQSPLITVETAAYCIGEESQYSVELLPDIDPGNYIWRVEGEAANNTEIGSYVSDGRSIANILWGSEGEGNVYLSIITGSECSLESQLPQSFTIKQTPDAPIINGPTQVCNMGTYNYTITPQNDVVSYEWILPLYAKDNATGAVNVQTTAPNLTVKFDEKFVTGQMMVVAYNACGAYSKQTIDLYNGAPELISPIKGPTSLKGDAQKMYEFNVPGANWYEWHVGGPDSSYAVIKGDTHTSSIALFVTAPLVEENDHHIILTAKAYEQEGGCPLAVTQQKISSSLCLAYNTHLSSNHDDLYYANGNILNAIPIDGNGIITKKVDGVDVINALGINGCSCPIGQLTSIEVDATLDIRCPLDVFPLDKDYMFGSNNNFVLYLDAEILTYNQDEAIPPLTSIPLSVHPFTFAITPQNPEQKFHLSLPLIEGQNPYRFITIRVKSYCYRLSSDANFCEDEISMGTENTFLALTDDCISLSLDYEPKMEINVQPLWQTDDEAIGLWGVTLSTATNTGGISVNPEGKFEWKLQGAYEGCLIDNYQFQLLKLTPTTSIESEVYNEHYFEVGHVDELAWKNALTIETQSSHNTLTLSLTEGNGPYFWRVRPIGNVALNGAGNDDNWGPWTNRAMWDDLDDLDNSESVVTDNQILTAQGIDGWVSGDPAFHFDIKQFDNDINWVYGRTFAEGNTDKNEQVRIGEEISYANTLLQPIQTQSQLVQTPGSAPSVSKYTTTNASTQLVTNDIVVASQSLYDYSGRLALQSLAAPIDGQQLSYKRNLLGGYGPEDSEYNANNFDADGKVLLPDNVTNGNINVYFDSSADPQIPSTNGRPYNRTLYYNDGTNRVKEQGTVGNVLGLGTTHTNKTSYAAASDDELIRLFGDEAPSYQTVYKVTQTDPNGVSSISYIDASGKTIATCLSGNDQITSLDILNSSEFTVQQSVTDDYLDGNDIVSTTTITLTESSSPLSITYDLDYEAFQNTCTNWCATCMYNVKIIITPIEPAGAPTIYYTGTLTPPSACPVTATAELIPPFPTTSEQLSAGTLHYH